LTGVQEVFLASFEEIRNESKTLVDESEEDLPVSTVMMDSFPVTRSSKRLNPSVSETREIRNVRTLAVYCYSSTAVHLAVQFFC
jgi:hypothetical protein